LASSALVVLPPADPDVCMDVFERDVTAALDNVAPLKNYTRRCSHVANKWLTNEAVTAKRASRRLERSFLRDRTVASYAAYQAARSKANELVTSSRTQYIAGEVASSSDNPRLLWRTVNRLLHPGGALSRYGGRSDIDVVTEFSEFCCEKLQRITDVIGHTLTSWLLPTTEDPPPSLFAASLTDFGVVTKDEVINAIKKLPNKSSPLDLLPTSLLKLFVPEIIAMITNIANASFSSGCFPRKMKIGQTHHCSKSPDWTKP